MLIGIDGNEANIKNRVGVGQYAFNILLHLSQLDSQNQYFIYLKNPPLPDLPSPRPNWQYQIFGPQQLWTRFALPLHLYFDRPRLDLFFSPSHYSPYFSPFPTIPTIHDLGYLNSPNQFTPQDLHQLIHWTKHSLARAAHVIAVSEFTKTEVNRIYHIPLQKITVAPNGVGLPAVVGDIPKIKKTKSTKYFLYLGTLKPNKNLPFLIKSFSKFVKKFPDYSLVIAGKKGWLFDEIFATVKNLKLENKVTFPGYVNDQDRWSLIANATAFIIPSTYEGFGIPAIEAMKVGTPVIASQIPAFIEVVDSAGLFINPQDENDLVQKMIQVLNSSTRHRLIKLGQKQCQKYTWTNTAKILIHLFSSFPQPIVGNNH